MPVSEAVVNLRPLTSIDGIPCRSLKFTPNTADACIGRASKRESKNLLPAQDNGLFDSRVMSRNHAQLIVRLDKKLAYLRDGGSMHGTYVNGKKLPSEEDYLLNQGDVITFGTEVIRGKDTFPPVQVRCEFDWHQSTPTPTNTFCVPDDDDNDANTDITPAVCPAASTSGDDDSVLRSDSDDQSVVEASSPFTSPMKKSSPNLTFYQSVNMLNDTNYTTHHGSRNMPINLDCDHPEQPLVTPRMTPPAAFTILDEEPSEAVTHLDVFVEETGLESSLGSSREENSDWEEEDDSIDYGDEEEVHSQCSLDSDMEEDPYEPYEFDKYKSMNSSHSHVLGIRDLIMSEPSFDFEEAARLNGGATEPRVGNEEGSGESISRSQACPSNLSVPEHNPTMPVSHNVKPSEIFPIQAPQPTNMLPLPLLCQQSRPLDNHLIGLQQNPLTSPIDWHPGHAYTLPIPISSRADYSDGPFMSELTAASGTANTSETTEPAVTNPTATIPGSKDIETDEKDIHATTVVAEQPTTSLSLLSEDSSLQQDPNPIVEETRPLKRKAEHIEEPPAYQAHSRESQTLDVHDKADFSETQPPNPSVEHRILPCSHPALVPANEVTTASQVPNALAGSDRPLKRVKKSAARNFASHAATAALGVAIGALGTIAALASLPPDYFHE
ncbi:FHA domain protein [Aspergillus homomorphus CBS 101889]|uniref:FHA domain-containing protein n=1 Tax=Aspergillus homomorphus (strain CBS 101889) TaxID=1450537 RepID=A0A395I2X0_ASPHC|nr:hypothetical protein BO97DRAFT_412609 [Aspergillus homomorphus CBS 101889]RAL14277.1 hypothetical protein BO97DRAFT_412609 [Aspergillus homomorphus CBS 101889]